MKLEKSYNTKQYFHSFYRQNHALLVLSFLFTVICFPANLIGSWLLGQVIDAITEVSMNRLRTIILVSIIFIVTMFFFTILLYLVKSNFIRKALIQYKNLAFEKISEKNIAAFSRENTGSYISMLTNDAASIEENYLRKSFLILHYVLLFFGTLIMMLRYSIVVSHQLDEALLRQYDEVIVIRDGTIYEHGKFDELIARRSYFYSLYHVSNG